LNLPRSLRALIKNKLSLIGMVIVMISVGCALFAPLLAPYDPYQQNLESRILPPVWAKGGTRAHILGTDPLGRDVLSRMIYGARVLLAGGALGVGIASAVGLTLGLIAGFFGGMVDTIIMGFTNLFMSFPYILLAIAFMAFVGPGFTTLVIVLGLCTWPMYTRI